MASAQLTYSAFLSQAPAMSLSSRFLRLVVLLTGLALGAQPSAAQTAPAPSQAAPNAPALSQHNPPPAKSAPAIIPGSPLAALTGAGANENDAKQTPAPFGTDEIGFALATVLGNEAGHTFAQFTDALKRSTRLTPVLSWMKSFTTQPQRRNNAAAIFAGLGIAFVPGVLLDLFVRFLLRQPMGFCARTAVPGTPRAETAQETEGLASAERGETEKRRWRSASLASVSRRLGFALLRFLLALLPLAMFGTFEQLCLNSGMIGTRAAHLAVVGLANAYLTARLAQEVLLLLLAPGAPSLRLVPMSTAHAKWTMRHALVVIITVFAEFSLISVAEILGLSKDGAGAVIRLAALIVNLEVAFIIWQSRRVVGRWMAGPPGAEGSMAELRRRLAKVWHVLAIFYVLAVWVAWAGGVRNALGTLLWAVLVVILALIIGRAAWKGGDMLLARLFPDSDSAAKPTTSTFKRRVRAYNPLIRFLIRAIVVALVVLLMLQGWGLDAFNWLLSNSVSWLLLNALFSILITVACAIILWEYFNYRIDRRIDRLNETGRTRHAARLRTLAPMLRAALGTVIIVATLIICLSRIGVNTTGLLAVSSVVGIAVGFGSQKLVQDLITGLFLLFEDAMQVGDVVTLGGMSGTVERLSIRTIRLRGGDGSINIIPFSSVTTVTNQTRDFSYAQISIMVRYEEDIDRVMAVLMEIGKQMRAEPAWGTMMRDDLQLFGLDSFDELGLVFAGQIRTGPGQHWSVRREFYARVQKRFKEEGIELPYRRQSLQLELPEEVIEHLGPELHDGQAKPDQPVQEKPGEAKDKS